MPDYRIVYSDELCHYGIPGMRWGVRRFQNKDGSLTNAGKKRYDVDIEGAKSRVKEAKLNEKKAVENYNRQTFYGTFYNQKAIDRVNDSAKKTRWAKQDLESEKIKQKLNNETKEKSSHRLKLEQQYMDKGMSKEEAEIAAYKRVKTEKILAVSAGVAVASAAAYVAYKQYDKNVDKVLKSGTTLQNISSDSNKGVSDAFYASLNKSDNTKYRGIYGNTIKSSGKDVYETKIKATKDLNMASQKSARNALNELLNEDPQFRKSFDAQLRSWKESTEIGKMFGNATPGQARVMKKASESYKNGKIDSNVYDAFNSMLVDHTNSNARYVSEKFYDKLKSKGYDAILDINDKKNSGYHSKKPIIVFNGGSKLSVDSIRQVGSSEIENAKEKGYMDIMVKSLAPQVAATGMGVAAGMLGSKYSSSKNDDKIVREYIKEHPNTKLSYKEILRNAK